MQAYVEFEMRKKTEIFHEDFSRLLLLINIVENQMYVLLYTVMVPLIKVKYSKHLTWQNYGYYHAFLSVKTTVMVWVQVPNVQVPIRISILDVSIYRVYGLMVWMFLLCVKQRNLPEIGVHQVKVR